MADNENTEVEQLLEEAAAAYAKHNSEETKAAWNEALGNIHATNVIQKDEGTA